MREPMPLQWLPFSRLLSVFYVAVAGTMIVCAGMDVFIYHRSPVERLLAAAWDFASAAAWSWMPRGDE